MAERRWPAVGRVRVLYLAGGTAAGKGCTYTKAAERWRSGSDPLDAMTGSPKRMGDS